jgi:integrase
MAADRRYFENKCGEITASGSDALNKVIVQEYLRFKQAQGLTYARLGKIAQIMCTLLERSKGRNLAQTRQEDVQNLVIWVNSQDAWKDWTKVTDIKVIKTFMSWLSEKYTLNLNLSKIRTAGPKNSILPEYLITEEEFSRLLTAAEDLQSKLFLGVLYESGARIGEILSLTIQSVTFNAYGARLLVHGKTGQRVIPIIWYAGLLRQFLESHPLRNDQNGTLWYQKLNGEIQPWSYDAVRMRLKRLAERAGVTKDIHPHLFRHTRMTELAKQLPEQTLKAMAGWAQDSKMASTYVHLANKDVEDSLLTKVYGIKLDEVTGKDKMKVCPKCSEPNPYFSRLCQRCSTPLDEKELMRKTMSEEKINEVESWSKILLAFCKAVEKKHPDIWEDMKDVMNPNAKLPQY